MKRLSIITCLSLFISVAATGIAVACSGTYYVCGSCGGDTPTKESLLNEAADNCPAGSHYSIIDIDTGDKSDVWVL